MCGRFLFHGFEPANVVRSYASAREAAASQNGHREAGKRYSLAFVGNNFQKWTQLRPALEALEQIGAPIKSPWWEGIGLPVRSGLYRRVSRE